MVPEALAGSGGRRGINLPPHGKSAARRTVGLEAAEVDNSPLEVSALSEGDDRRHTINVAGPAALLVAKLHTLGERRHDPRRLNDKDAHDVYGLFAAVPTLTLAGSMRGLRDDPLSDDVTQQALTFLVELFAAGADARGCLMAGQTERLVGDPDFVAAAVNALASDLLVALGTRSPDRRVLLESAT